MGILYSLSIKLPQKPLKGYDRKLWYQQPRAPSCKVGFGIVVLVDRGGQIPFCYIHRSQKLLVSQDSQELNAFQAWWALLFTCFQFTLSNRPRTKNTQADSFSLSSTHLHVSVADSLPGLFLPPQLQPGSQQNCSYSSQSVDELIG